MAVKALQGLGDTDEDKLDFYINLLQSFKTNFKKQA